jgi:hypothetical protein
MGLYYWINEVYCHADSAVGELFLYVILSIHTLWKIIGGISLVAGELYLAVLAFWGYQEQLLVHYTLSLKFRESRPRCSTVFDGLVEESRIHAMPSFETQMIFFGSSFLIIHMILVRYGFPLKMLVMIVGLPFVATGALYITNNNTLEQITFGALVGTVLGVRNVLLYHFFLKYHLEKLTMLQLLKWVVPSGKVLPLQSETKEDQDTRMLKANLPAELDSSEPTSGAQRDYRSVGLLEVT